MFGHDDDNQQPAQDSNGALNAAMPEPVSAENLEAGTAVNQPLVSPSTPAGAPSMSEPHLPSPPTPAPSSDLNNDDTSTPALQSTGSDELLHLKQQALQHLSPLVSHLDQTPEEKFRTTMMMIQASDDQTLIKAAFEAAQAITDDKARAQALLDIINEINYFTQHQNQ
jgi:hypothetical protein